MKLDYISHIDCPNYFMDEDNTVFAIYPWISGFLLEMRNPYSFRVRRELMNKINGGWIKIL